MWPTDNLWPVAAMNYIFNCFQKTAQSIIFVFEQKTVKTHEESVWFLCEFSGAQVMSLSLSDASALSWEPFVIGGIHYVCSWPPRSWAQGSPLTCCDKQCTFIMSPRRPKLSNCLGDTSGWDSNLSCGGLLVSELVTVYVCLYICVCWGSGGVLFLYYNQVTVLPSVVM